MQIGEFEVFFGWSPNQVVIRGRGQHVRISSRDGEVHDFMVEDAVRLAGRCADLSTQLVAPVALRSYWGDNSSGSADAKIDIILDEAQTEPGPQLEFDPTTEHGQSLNIEIRVLRERMSSDHFEVNAEKHYM